MKKEYGFTMIELLIVIAIIGIIAAFAIPTYFSFIKKAKRVEAQRALSEVQRRESMYFVDNEVYSTDLVQIGVTSPLKYYTITVSVNNSNNTFLATAQGNIDMDAALDIWTVDETNTLIHVNKD